MLPLDKLNRMSRDEFAAALGEIFEHSPWVAARAWDTRPFDSVATLHRAMVEAVHGAGRELQITLVAAHPDLAGRLAHERKLSEHSTREQASAGLDSLTDTEFAHFARLNARYRERFGFPFVVCVRDHDKVAILDAFERRVANAPERELVEALSNVARIAELRLAALVAESRTEKAPS